MASNLLIITIITCFLVILLYYYLRIDINNEGGNLMKVGIDAGGTLIKNRSRAR